MKNYKIIAANPIPEPQLGCILMSVRFSNRRRHTRAITYAIFGRAMINHVRPYRKESAHTERRFLSLPYLG